MSKILGEIIEGLSTRRIVGGTERPVSGLVTDSRKVEKDSLFACIGGSRVDGHDFAAEAAGLGAGSMLCEREVEVGEDVTQVVVADVRRALANVSSKFHDNPSHSLKVVGVTGTNGKTTTAHLIRSVLEAWGRPVGVLGTLGHRIKNSVRVSPYTTPEAPDVHGYMREMLDRSIEFCVMEVSSHALALSRVDHVDFDVVVFTNLSRDHLDFHKTWKDYRAAKMLLFGIGDDGRFLGENRSAVVNVGDPTGAEIADRTPLPVSTYSLTGKADFTGRISKLDQTGTDLAVTAAGETVPIHTGLRGEMNAANVLAAYSVAATLGVDTGAISAGIAGLDSLPGRMEFIEGPGRQGVVDYAHTPDALKRLLEDVRRVCRGRLICVFGCGGDRDHGKRPEMGEVAARLADLVIVTTDNPRTEAPLKIIEAIIEGIPQGVRYEAVPDRADAIQRAVSVSIPGDIVVVAGKGHEDYQIVGEKRIHFSDRETLGRAFGVITDAKA
jgi:UDP-N-acetylmuramoyl-L-alanyl-D-glutamate--2,6-diaminopimelate ligase